MFTNSQLCGLQLLQCHQSVPTLQPNIEQVLCTARLSILSQGRLMLSIVVITADRSIARNVLNITVDNELREFYFNGNNISVASNFPNAVYWNRPDSYNLEGDIHVLALKMYNNEFSGGFIASTPDDYILTNKTWKCTLEYYDGWYKIHYNDSLWPDAKLQSWDKDAKLLTYFSPNAKWIIDSTDCKSCLFFCRKSFIGKI
ncbi:hypothetical protein HELRODRAFT_172400 [Helobdella robusta]|uniref:Uncharacterized protein n=1 Tax=Helobdella robusta TaxID=6412 RepID=T1F598_HELRO|nr:hypothetical protein HELRODRAFT_172400 [Helobdella robusta]ESO04725.1 hypothetical protein HELRODRAFT_172400 [Helobdella robusta]